MATIIEADLKANELSEDIIWHITIRGYTGWKFRLRIALLLLRLAGWISGMGFIFTGVEEEKHHG